jgi:hypothetical protein
MPGPQISSEAVKAKTGKTWDEWFALLDANGCAKMDHREIVAVLLKIFHVEDWWQQMNNVSYEQASSKRLLH